MRSIRYDTLHDFVFFLRFMRPLTFDTRIDSTEIQESE